jgi:predicted acetyltransferase
MLRLILLTDKTKEIGKLLLTCSPQNEASNKTIISNGGKFTQTLFVDIVQEERNHYWIDLQGNGLKIRPAKAGDEEQLARVHIQSWQEAYAGLIPQDYLDQLPSELNGRIGNWKKTLKNPNRFVWVAEGEKGIVGFVLFGPPRDANKEGYIELGAIYLLASAKGKKVGFSLLSAGFNKMRDLGYKKAYCWVLENNPTIKFYERTGAKFSSQVKQDEIGGKLFNEFAYEWEDLNIGEYNWEPLSLEEIKKLFKKLEAPWIIAGGWAIDLFLKKQTRKHSDVDILINRKDQSDMQTLLKDWDVWVADPPGTLRPLKIGEFCPKGIQDIWVRKTPTDPWQFQIMLFDTEDHLWVFKRDQTIKRDLQSVVLENEDGIKFLSPEVQLLYKSKAIREKDELDFQNVLGELSSEQKSWLSSAMLKVYSGSHPWLSALKI